MTTDQTTETCKTFTTFESVDGLARCRKNVVVQAKQINEPFRVDTLEGNYKQGKAGDFLMKGVEGELYICDREIFLKSYEWVE